MGGIPCRVLKSGIALITQNFHYKGQYGFNNTHLGNDLVNYAHGYSELDYIVAHSEGTVVGIETGYTGPYFDGSYGNYVLLKHPNGMYTIYAHLAYNTVAVSYGDNVAQGQTLGYMDNSGESHGGHLHFEVRNSAGNKIDPEPYLNADLPGLDTKVWFQKWHLYDKAGNMLTGWQQSKGEWYLLDGNGIMLTGWQKVGGKWYFMHDTGAMAKGWLQVNKNWYYLTVNADDNFKEGEMRTGWMYDDYYKAWFLFANSGEMLTGWQQIGDKWYYLDPNSGKMYANGTYTIDGKQYTFNESGVWIS